MFLYYNSYITKVYISAWSFQMKFKARRLTDNCSGLAGIKKC
jgi:hypothetical protein